jgi:uncharacterized protein YndB with AHSA1/START domain
MGDLTVRDSVEIKAPAEKVWQVLTDPAYTRQYMFNTEPVTDWREGSDLLWRGVEDGKVYVKGSVLGIRPPHLLQYTAYGPDAPDRYEDKPENYTTVTIELTATESGTRLAVSQGDFAGVMNGGIRFEHSTNSWRTVLARIRELSEESGPQKT